MSDRPATFPCPICRDGRQLYEAERREGLWRCEVEPDHHVLTDEWVRRQREREKREAEK
jgi:hypothetical protein